MRRSLLLALAVVHLAAPAAAYESVHDQRLWALTGLAVVDAETGEIARDRTILIQNGLIQAIGDESILPASGDVLVVDHAGQYAIPGLWDMHVHLRGGPRFIDANELWLRQYVGFGVTSVRDAGGDLPDAVLRWRKEIAAGDIVGPRIYTALRKLDGPGLRQSGSIPVASLDDVEAAFDDLTAAGADFIKLYEISFPPDLYVPALREAEARGLRTAAHVSLYVPLYDLIDAGLDSMEHVFFFMKAANPDDRRLSLSTPVLEPLDFTAYFAQYVSFGDRAEESYARQTFRRMARRGVAITPTLNIEQAAYAFMTGRSIDSARAEQTPAIIRETLERTVEEYAYTTDAMLPSSERFLEHAARFLAPAAEEGVTILAGSDTGTGNAWMYPGDSLHGELEQLVAFGLSPLEALQAATVNAARWFGVQERFGSIEPGAAADIVILRENPLDDIRNTRSIAAVVQQGVYFDAARLRGLTTLPHRAARR